MNYLPIIGGAVGAIIFSTIVGTIRYKKIQRTIDELEYQNAKLRAELMKVNGVIEKC